MIRSVQKKTSPKVIGGKVQKKNNWTETPNYYMTTRSKSGASRGEGYAEEYAKRYTDQIWTRYLDTFGLL